MTKTIGKCLVVFTVAACVAFLGFAAVSAVGGPNWLAETKLEDLADFAIFEKSVGETTTWSAKTRRKGEDIKNPKPKVLAAAIVEARKLLESEQDAEIDQLQQQIDAVTPYLAEAKQLIETDVQALKKRGAELAKQLEDVNKSIIDLSNEGIRKSQETQAKRAEAQKRREDIARLTVELSGISSDLFRAKAQAGKLQDLLVRIRGSIDRLERRKAQLLKAGAKLSDRPYEEKSEQPEQKQKDGKKAQQQN